MAGARNTPAGNSACMGPFLTSRVLLLGFVLGRLLAGAQGEASPTGASFNESQMAASDRTPPSSPGPPSPPLSAFGGCGPPSVGEGPAANSSGLNVLPWTSRPRCDEQQWTLGFMLGGGATFGILAVMAVTAGCCSRSRQQPERRRRRRSAPAPKEHQPLVALDVLAFEGVHVAMPGEPGTAYLAWPDPSHEDSREADGRVSPDSTVHSTSETSQALQALSQTGPEPNRGRGAEGKGDGWPSGEAGEGGPRVRAGGGSGRC